MKSMKDLTLHVLHALRGNGLKLSWAARLLKRNLCPLGIH